MRCGCSAFQPSKRPGIGVHSWWPWPSRWPATRPASAPTDASAANHTASLSCTRTAPSSRPGNSTKGSSRAWPKRPDPPIAITAADLRHADHLHGARSRSQRAAEAPPCGLRARPPVCHGRCRARAWCQYTRRRRSRRSAPHGFAGAFNIDPTIYAPTTVWKRQAEPSPEPWSACPHAGGLRNRPAVFPDPCDQGRHPRRRWPRAVSPFAPAARRPGRPGRPFEEPGLSIAGDVRVQWQRAVVD